MSTQEAPHPLKPPRGDFWVFGYGSLMWDPGFPYLREEPALLYGYHRAFCIYSQRYRGTRERPGLVLGLDRGGACRGRAFRVAAADGEAVICYLYEREMFDHVYEPRWLEVLVGRRRVRALAHVANRANVAYAGKLADARVVEIILGGHGARGPNIDYLVNTVAHIDELCIADTPIHRILRLVEAKRRA